VGALDGIGAGTQVLGLDGVHCGVEADVDVRLLGVRLQDRPAGLFGDPEDAVSEVLVVVFDDRGAPVGVRDVVLAVGWVCGRCVEPGAAFGERVGDVLVGLTL